MYDICFLVVLKTKLGFASRNRNVNTSHCYYSRMCLLTSILSISFVSGSTSMSSWSRAEIWRTKTKNKLTIWKVCYKHVWLNFLHNTWRVKKVSEWMCHRPLGRSCLSSLSPPPAAWWRFLWPGRAGCASSGVSHTWGTNSRTWSLLLSSLYID